MISRRRFVASSLAAAAGAVGLYTWRVEPHWVLAYTHFSPLAGAPDVPENYHTVTITLADAEGGTSVMLKQDNNATEQEVQHSRKNWEGMLGALKQYVEGR